MSKSPHCPICHTELDTVPFLLKANEVFSEVGHKVRFDCCGTVFYIEADAEVAWYKKVRKHYPKYCENKKCQKAIFGRRKKYCSVNCKNAAYYERNKKRVLEQQKEYRHNTYATRVV